MLHVHGVIVGVASAVVILDCFSTPYDRPDLRTFCFFDDAVVSDTLKEVYRSNI